MHLPDLDDDSTSDSGFNGAAPLFTPRKPPEKSPSHSSFDILPCDYEDYDNIQSEPLFDLEPEDLEENTRDHSRGGSVDCAKKNGSHTTRDSRKNSESSSMFDSRLIPDIELIEDDQATVYFDQDNASNKSNKSSSSIFSKEEEKTEKNQPPPVLQHQDNDSLDSTPDLENIEAEPGEAGDLDDSEGDRLVGSLVEEAVGKFAIPALQKVMKWREETKEALEAAPHASRQSPSHRRPRKRASPPPCIHLHFHEASSTAAPSTAKESKHLNSLLPN